MRIQDENKYKDEIVLNKNENMIKCGETMIKRENVKIKK